MSGNQSISSIGSYPYGGMYDPAMMAMMTGYSTGGLGSYTGYGMGMYPTAGIGNYMEQYADSIRRMNQIQHQMEADKLKQGTEMHALMQQADVYNLSAHDRAFFEKAMQDGAIQKGVRDIYDAIRIDSNLKYAVQRYFQLRQEIQNKYSDYFNTPAGQVNLKENIDKLIQDKYAQIGYALNPSEPAPDLKNDVRNFGENPFQNGFNTAFLGEHGHNTLTGEEALNQMFGTGINDSGSKRRAKWLGDKTANYIVEPAGAIGIGAVGGAAAGITALGIGKMFTEKCQGLGKWAKWGALIGASLTFAGDMYWKATRP